MPIYEYEPLIGECGLCGGRFEELQEVAAPPLETCPMCEAPCRRVMSAARVQHAKQLRPDLLTNENIERNGFVRYEKKNHETWERTAGTEEQGPRVLRKDGSTEE